ncbi:WYL domain-containing protein [Marinilabiliaceae bacterium ANBcel2]|nr:WYL domain-containing protein [Marinilabiliaceae bacterium ANBcel2]
MTQQTTLQRTLELMILLARPGGATVKCLAEGFDVHERTIQRTFQTIRDAGYYIREYRGRYYMDKEENAQKARFDVSQLLSFTREEIVRIKSMFDNIPSNHSYDHLMSKILGAIGLENSAASVIQSHQFVRVETIRKAIKEKKQILVKTYSWSTGGKSYNNIKMEPIGFALDYTRVWCYFPEINRNLLVRLTDMDSVKLSETSFQHKEKHKTGYIDAFGASGFEKSEVVIDVNLQARGYLMSEFAIERKEFKTIHNEESSDKRVKPRYRFQTEVCGYFHIARFCMGLPNDVRIITPKLKRYIESIQNKPKECVHEPSTVYFR